MTITGELGLLLDHAYAGRALGEHLVTQGHTAEARELFEMGLEVMRRVGAYAGEAGFVRRLARVALHDGDLDTAFTLASRALSMSESGGGALYAQALWALSDVHAARGDEATAMLARKESRNVFDQMGSKEGPVLGP